MGDPHRIAVTGASGLLGRALLLEAARRGLPCAGMHLPRGNAAQDPRVLRELFKSDGGWSTLIHCGAVLRPKTPADRFANAELPALLEKFLHQFDPTATFIHVSSLNVLIEGLKDPYTESKREAERRLDHSHSVIVRPSLIWSPRDEGAAGEMRAFLLRFPIAVMVRPGNRHRPVLVDSLAESLIDLAEEQRRSGIVNIMGDEHHTLWSLARAMAGRLRRPLVPIPAPFHRGWLPRALCSIDYTQLSTAWRLGGEEEMIMPFSDQREEMR